MSNAYRSAAIQGAATQTVISGIGPRGSPACEGILHTLTIGASTSVATLTAYDNTSATGNPIYAMSLAATSAPLCAMLDIQLVNGLTLVVTGASAAVTATFK